jgi:CRP/FNR family transcriptional regulator
VVAVFFYFITGKKEAKEVQEEHEVWRAGIPDTFYPVKKLQNYIEYGTVKFLSKGSYTAFSGEGANELVYVLSGRLQLNYLFTDGRERMVFFGGKHSVFSQLYQAAFKTNFDAYLLALEDSKVCCFSKDKIELISKINGEISLDLLKNSDARASFFMKQAVEMDCFNSTIRIVRLLYELCISQGVSVGDHIEVNLNLPLKSISAITGAHCVTVSKVFTALKNNNVLIRKKNKIMIYNLPQLKELIQYKHLEI